MTLRKFGEGSILPESEDGVVEDGVIGPLTRQALAKGREEAERAERERSAKEAVREFVLGVDGAREQRRAEVLRECGLEP